MAEQENRRLEALAETVAGELAGDTPPPDVLERAPDLTMLEAYRVQRAMMARRVAAGDRIVGYKAALTSKPMQAQAGVHEPLLGTLLASREFAAGQPLSLRGFFHSTLEPEVAVRLKAPLAGPGLTLAQVRAAVGEYLPAVELGDLRVGPGALSAQHGIVCNTFNGGYVIGGPSLAAEGIDLREEGMVLTANGEVRGEATAAEVLGDPLNAVLFLAEKLAELGQELQPGMLLLTGSIVQSIEIAPGDEVTVAFTRLGELRLRFVE